MSAPAEVFCEPVSKQCLRVWLKLLKANGTIESILRRKLREDHASTLPRFDVMAALHRSSDGLKMSEISDLLRVSNGNITAIVDRLVEDGLVSRQQAANDRRAIEIQLTDKGRITFQKQAADHEAWVESLLSGIGSRNLDALMTMLEDINNHLEALGDGK